MELLIIFKEQPLSTFLSFEDLEDEKQTVLSRLESQRRRRITRENRRAFYRLPFPCREELRTLEETVHSADEQCEEDSQESNITQERDVNENHCYRHRRTQSH